MQNEENALPSDPGGPGSPGPQAARLVPSLPGFPGAESAPRNTSCPWKSGSDQETLVAQGGPQSCLQEKSRMKTTSTWILSH